MPNKYRARPLGVEAIQWCGYNADEMQAFLGDRFVAAEPAAGHMPALLTFKDKYGRQQQAVSGMYLLRDEQMGVKAVDWALFINTYQPIMDAPVSTSAQTEKDAKAHERNGRGAAPAPAANRATARQSPPQEHQG